MSKPKTGKAIMTDGEIFKEYYKCQEFTDSFTDLEVRNFMAQARQQGIAEGIAKEEKANLETNKTLSWIDARQETADMMWEEYALCDDAKLTKDAQRVKKFLWRIAEKGRAEDTSWNDVLISNENTKTRIKKEAYSQGFDVGYKSGKSQGLVYGRMDMKGKLREAEKQAYAKGRDENKDKYFNAGIQKGKSDLKARLMSKEVLDKICVGYDDTPYILAKDVMKQALAEAERK
jgi:hypothetical protein